MVFFFFFANGMCVTGFKISEGREMKGKEKVEVKIYKGEKRVASK